MKSNGRRGDDSSRSVLRRDAADYSLRWKLLYGLAVLIAYCVLLFGVRYFVYGVDVDDILSSGSFYLSAIGTGFLIGGIYWVMTDRNKRER